jgi:hypothetical protein
VEAGPGTEANPGSGGVAAHVVYAHHRQGRHEFADNVCAAVGIRGNRIEKPCTNRLWLACSSMPVHRLPDLSRIQANTKLRLTTITVKPVSAIASGGAGIVSGKNQNGIVPDGPNNSADQRRRGVTVRFGELRSQEAAPPNLFSESARTTGHHSRGCCEEQVQGHCRPTRERAEAKALRNIRDELAIVRAAQANDPNAGASDRGIRQRNQLAHQLIARFALFEPSVLKL